MNTYQVVFIPHGYDNVEDSCDYKEWRFIYTETEEEALEIARKRGYVISIEKHEGEDNQELVNNILNK